jgi:hypothetical protein
VTLSAPAVEGVELERSGAWQCSMQCHSFLEMSDGECAGAFGRGAGAGRGLAGVGAQCHSFLEMSDGECASAEREGGGKPARVRSARGAGSLRECEARGGREACASAEREGVGGGGGGGGSAGTWGTKK